MYKNKTILALIPARGGSKGLPKKNIKLLAGKPLIAWTIEQAKKSRYLDRIVVSTEDKAIASVARKYGADLPFMRPKKLAKDNSKLLDAIFYTLNKLEQKYDLILLLQPTSPLRKTKDIDNSIRLLFKKCAQAIVSISPTESHPYKSNILPSNGCLKSFAKAECNRQELKLFYRVNGAIFLAYSDYLKKNRSFFNKQTFGYLMPKERSLDIDTEIDFKVAQLLIRKPKK